VRAFAADALLPVPVALAGLAALTYHVSLALAAAVTGVGIAIASSVT
jgi:hypothetical protein